MLEDESAQARTVDALGDLAYDVMLEYGPVVELRILSQSAFAESRERGSPFLETVVREAGAEPEDAPDRSDAEPVSNELLAPRTGPHVDGRTRSQERPFPDAEYRYEPISVDAEPRRASCGPCWTG